jgi:hypothetical protein
LAMGRVAGQWAAKEPQAAAEWVTQQAAGVDASKSAMRSVVGNWASRDEFSAAEWLAEQPPGPATDGAIIGLTERVARKDPESAAYWVLAMSDPEDRSSHLARVAGQWLKKDRAAAVEWLSSNPDVPAEVREKVLPKGE